MATEIELLEAKLNRRLYHLEVTRNTRTAPIGPWRMKVTDRYLDGGIPPADESWGAIALGETWRTEPEATWFLASAVVPEGWSGGPVVAGLDVGSESQVFVNERMVEGLGRWSGEATHLEVILAESAQPGARFEFAVEATRNWALPGGQEPVVFRTAELVVPNETVRDLIYWGRIALDSARTLPEGSTPRVRMVRLLDDAFRPVNLHLAGTEEFRGQVQGAVRALRDGLDAIGPGLGSITLVGHAHIDTAWLWPLSETRRKCGRTFSNMLRLMERFPDFHFGQSQPQLYQFTKESFPDLYAGIKARIATGQWEPVGGAWVECDCNISGGEALIRQLLYGKRFFRQEFGVDTKVGWWPDAFGYNGSMPQILKHCGMDHFYSIKISWNQYNTFPCGLFKWRGIDGTEILAFHGTVTYNGSVTPAELTQCWKEFPERDRVENYLHTFGFGDGGGGPTVDMVERGRRLAKMPGVPKCQFGRADEFFAAAKTEADRASVWEGELYFELHRGCQTTQARTKRGNRKLELALRETEQLGAVSGAAYPQAALQTIWEQLLCHQFHDILPGTSVRRVYEEAEETYPRLLRETRTLRDASLQTLAANADTRGEGQAVVVYNSLGWERTEVVEVTVKLSGEAFHAVSPSGKVSPCQVIGHEGDAVTLLLLARDLPALGHAVYHILPGAAPEDACLSVTNSGFENAALQVVLDREGHLTSVFDKAASREVFAPGAKGNLLQLFDDRPYGWDAWDIDPWFEDRQWEVPAAESLEVVETGPVRASLRFVRRMAKSTITQEVRLYAHSRRLEFVTHVDWHEKKVLLKAAFPVDVLAPEATYEIQFGAVQRPTHANTSWDRAKFEVPAHRWADLSETGYGVALLNDCKYGYDIRGNVMRLSLLRGTTDPDTDADQGEHEFTYALYPHPGTWQEAEIVRRGWELNVPLIALAAEGHGGASAAVSALSCNRPNVVLDTLKKAEDGDDLILRLYEAHGARGPVEVRLALPVTSVVECNGMEEETGPADFREGVLRFAIKPWQIRAFRLIR